MRSARKPFLDNSSSVRVTRAAGHRPSGAPSPWLGNGATWRGVSHLGSTCRRMKIERALCSVPHTLCIKLCAFDVQIVVLKFLQLTMINLRDKTKHIFQDDKDTSSTEALGRKVELSLTATSALGTRQGPQTVVVRFTRGSTHCTRDNPNRTQGQSNQTKKQVEFLPQRWQ